MNTTVLLITPPFTQLNTPYPATAYLKGFLNTKNISSHQADLGIEVTLELFNKKNLSDIFNQSQVSSENAKRIFLLKEEYIKTIDEVILFLQGKKPTIAHLIASRNFYQKQADFYKLMI